MSLGQAVRRDRLVAAAALVLLAALAWAALVRMGAGPAAAPPHAGMAHMGGWSAGELLLLFAMWTVMMTAMMLPAAAPMILLFTTVGRRRRERGTPAVPTAAFVAGYLLVWSGFSAAAAVVQLGLHQAALLSPAMASTTPVLGGALLVTAGLWQWLPAKGACLSRCRSPLHFLATEWREGKAGALVMGFRHGLFCLGCCWALMTLLFVGGVMNLLWVAAIAGLVLVEKVAAGGAWIGRLAGLVLAAWGVWMLAAG